MTEVEKNRESLSCRDVSISECGRPDSTHLILDTPEMLKLAAALPLALSTESGERGMFKTNSAHLESRLHHDDASILMVPPSCYLLSKLGPNMSKISVKHPKLSTIHGPQHLVKKDFLY